MPSKNKDESTKYNADFVRGLRLFLARHCWGRLKTGIYLATGTPPPRRNEKKPDERRTYREFLEAGLGVTEYPRLENGSLSQEVLYLGMLKLGWSAQLLEPWPRESKLVDAAFQYLIHKLRMQGDISQYPDPSEFVKRKELKYIRKVLMFLKVRQVPICKLTPADWDTLQSEICDDDSDVESGVELQQLYERYAAFLSEAVEGVSFTWLNNKVKDNESKDG